MTDNEIIKALEESISFDEPYESDFTLIRIKYIKNALDLINRLKAENKKNENIIRIADKTIETQNAEIERLKKQLDDKCDRCIARDKSEVRKEFAERLKGAFCSMCEYDGGDIKDAIDNLLKEMG